MYNIYILEEKKERKKNSCFSLAVWLAILGIILSTLQGNLNPKEEKEG
jgi:hypothetical protein